MSYLYLAYIIITVFSGSYQKATFITKTLFCNNFFHSYNEKMILMAIMILYNI